MKAFWGELRLTFRKANVPPVRGGPNRVKLATNCVKAAITSLRSARTGVGYRLLFPGWKGRGETVATFFVAVRRGGLTSVSVHQCRHRWRHPDRYQTVAAATGLGERELSGLFGKRGEPRYEAFARLGEWAAAAPAYLLWEHPPADHLPSAVCSTSWGDGVSERVARDMFSDWLGVDLLEGPLEGESAKDWLWSVLGSAMEDWLYYKYFYNGSGALS